MIEVETGSIGSRQLRFAVSPVAELVWSTVVLRKPERSWPHRRWRDDAAHRLAGYPLDALFAATSGRSYLPDFLMPTPDSARPSLADQLRRVAATPAERVRAEIRRVDPIRRHAALTEFDTDPAGTLDRLVDQMRCYFDAVLASSWPRLRTLAESDVARRTTPQPSAKRSTAGSAAPADTSHHNSALLADLHPRVSWGDGRLRVAVGTTLDRLVLSPAQAITLIPVAFAWPYPIASDSTAPGGLADGWSLGYPPDGVGSLWKGRPVHRPLDTLLGVTRAQLLGMLTTPRDTAGVARRLGISPATASYHLGALRDAGLAVSVREGRYVRYCRTPLGDQLVNASEG